MKIQLKSTGFLILSLLLNFLLVSCNQANDDMYPASNNDNIFSAKAVVVDAGVNAADGCDWMIRIGEIYYHPINLAAELQVDELEVEMEYKMLEEVFYCGIAALEYRSIEILSARQMESKCDVEGVLHNYFRKLDGCGWVIELTNGEKLEPTNLEDLGFKAYDGQKIRFAYSVLEEASTCTVGPVVKIDCITEIKDRPCEYKGVVKDYTGQDGCSWVIELDNGDHLEPVELESLDFELYDGQKIKCSYTELERVSACMLGKVVRIDCIKEIGGSACTHEGVVRDYTGKLDGCGWVIEMSNGEKLELVEIADPDFQIYDGQKIKFGYTVMKNLVSICMTGPMVRLECAEDLGDAP